MTALSQSPQVSGLTRLTSVGEMKYERLYIILTGTRVVGRILALLRARVHYEGKSTSIEASPAPALAEASGFSAQLGRDLPVYKVSVAKRTATTPMTWLA